MSELVFACAFCRTYTEAADAVMGFVPERTLDEDDQMLASAAVYCSTWCADQAKRRALR